MIDKIYDLCFVFLYHLADKLNITYKQINVLIFCIIVPVIMIASISLNVYLLLK